MSEAAGTGQTQEFVSPHQDSLLVVSNPRSEAWQQGFSIEAQVFIEAGYVESESELAEEYEPYLPHSEFIVAERDGVVGGAVRAISYSEEAGFKTIHDLEDGRLDLSDEGKEALEQVDLTKTTEIGTLAVKKELRGLMGEQDRLAVILYGAIYALTKQRGTEFIIASFDEKFFHRFKSIFGDGVIALGPAKDYMGSNTVPSVMHVDTVMAHLKETLEPVDDMMLDAAGKVKYD